jgi:hypothetical protein
MGQQIAVTIYVDIEPPEVCDMPLDEYASTIYDIVAQSPDAPVLLGPMIWVEVAEEDQVSLVVDNRIHRTK